MIETECFYGTRKTTRVRTTREAYEAVQNAPHANNVAILPPAALIHEFKTVTLRKLMMIHKRAMNQQERLKRKRLSAVP